MDNFIIVLVIIFKISVSIAIGLGSLGMTSLIIACLWDLL